MIGLFGFESSIVLVAEENGMSHGERNLGSIGEFYQSEEYSIDNQ